MVVNDVTVNVPVPPSALIIDDNFYNRDIFRIALETVGFVTVQIDNGADGLAVLKERTFNLLILDLQMPSMDGRTVLNAIHGETMHQMMRIVVVTANPHMVTTEIEKQADYVMYKPINVAEFARFADRLKRVTPV